MTVATVGNGGRDGAGLSGRAAARRVARATFGALAVAAAACGPARGGATRGAIAAGIDVAPAATVRALKAGEPQAIAPVRSHRIGSIERKAIGPFGARAPDGGLVAWILASERGGEELVVVPTGIDGAPLAPPKVASKVPQEVTSLVVRRAGGTHGGWLAAWTAIMDRGEALTVLGLAPDGTAKVGPLDVQRTSDHLKWADVVPSAHGATCVWAEETPAGEANILAAPLDTDGRPHDMPVRVARGVSGWAAVPAPAGVGLALVTPSRADGGRSAGSLSWLTLDAEGRPSSAPVVLGSRPSVSSDVDVAPFAGGWLFAWTDATGEDEEILLATVDAAGRVQGPRRALDAVGGARLVALAAGPAGAALAWQETRGKAREMHSLHLASIDVAEPAAKPGTALEVATRAVPELVATEHGFGLVVPARACAAGAADDHCDAPVVPSFVRFDARLSPVQTEPLLVGDAHAEASLGWNLRCDGDHCVALAATADSPTAIYAVDLPPRASGFAAPLAVAPPAGAPRVLGVTTLASGQAYAELSATRAGEATLVATLTTSVEAATARRATQRKSAEDRHAASRARGAVVAVRAFDDRAQPLGPASELTARALSVGGVAVAAGGKPADGALVAWVARDDGDPQVHLSHVDGMGRRTNEVQLTTARGDASDVAVAWAGDGWLVAWVDARDGNGEIYATKVDRDLKRTAREERITNAPGDAGDLSLAVRGRTALLAWSDPRESPREGLADIYVSALRTRDARRTGDEVRVLATAGHSRSPRIVPAGDGAIVAWIEDAPTGLEGPGAAMVARLSADLRVVAKPAALPAAGQGRPTALALAPFEDGARAIVARSERDDMSLEALAVAGDGRPGQPFRLLDLDAPGSFDLALGLLGDAIFFDDIGPTPAAHRVRRAAVSWPR
jgi:hypothetical protein